MFCVFSFKKSLAKILIFLLFFQYLQIPILQAVELSKVSQIINTPLVALLVEDSLLENAELKTKIYQYAEDVQKTLNVQSLLIPVSAEISPLEIYEGLSQFYFSGVENDGRSQLVGTVLIGDVPIPVVEKNENFWPTIYPYTDFENETYQWDFEKNRFVFVKQGDSEPEIWHGVIKSEKSKSEQRIYELKSFFDKNHKVHSGQEKYSKKVFYADFFRQKKVIPDLLFFKYKQWLKYAEEIQYNHLTKHLARQLKEESETFSSTTNIGGTLTEDEKRAIAEKAVEQNSSLSVDQILESMNLDSMDLLPDMQSKLLIDSYLQRYVENYKSWLTLLHKRIGKANRWDPTEIETTVSLVSQKDEASLLVLKAFNEAVEKKLIEKVEAYNVPTEYPIVKNMEVTYPLTADEDITEKKSLYWNGVLRDENFDAEDCTLFRGFSRSETFPFAQQVKAIQAYDIESTGLCAHKSELTSVKNEDKYEGCCAKNLKYENNVFSYERCDTDSFWQVSPLYNGLPVHIGAELPVFDIAGTQEENGKTGASGCEAIFALNEFPEVAVRIPSLMIHDEPRPETLLKQSSAKITRALPVDDPRGFSFYDHGKIFHRVDFPNVFDFREKTESLDDMKEQLQTYFHEKIKEINLITEVGTQKSKNLLASERSIFWPDIKFQIPVGSTGECHYSHDEKIMDVFTTQLLWNESCEIETVVEVLSDGTEVIETTHHNKDFSRFYETGKLFPETLLDDVLDQIGTAKLFEALDWIDKNIEEKNKIAFEKAFSEKDEYQKFFFDTVSDGYELTEIIADGNAKDGVEMTFSPLNKKVDKEFMKAKEKIAGYFSDEDDYQFQFLDENIGDTFLEREAESECDSLSDSMFDWPKKIACALSKTTQGKEKKVKLSLGKKEKVLPIIENLEVNLSESILSIEPDEIFISNDQVNPIPIKVALKNIKGEIRKDNFSTSVKLVFSSSDANKFFTISPAQSLPLTAGEATFFLLPKTNKFGGKLEVSAKIEAVGGISLASKKVPIKISKFAINGYSEIKEIVANDKSGFLVKAQVKDKNGNFNPTYEGENLNFTSSNGIFMGGMDSAKIENGVARIRFFPNKKAGLAKIKIASAQNEIPSDEVFFIILPEKPATLKLKKKSPYLIESSDYLPFASIVIDEFGNEIENVWHELSWEVEDLEIENFKEKDQNPRKEGVQAISYTGKNMINIRAKEGEKSGRISVFSDLFGEKAGKSKELIITKNPIFETVVNKKTVVVGTKTPIEIFVKIKTNDNELITEDFDVKLASNLGRVPSSLELKNGKGLFKFYSGIVSGKAEILISHAGFVDKKVVIEILPDEPKKLKFVTEKSKYELDSDEKILFEVMAVDRFGNLTPKMNDTFSLKITEPTKHLLAIDSEKISNQDFKKLASEVYYLEEFETKSLLSNPTLIDGKSIIKAFPKDLSGTVHLIAEHKSLIGDILELDLTNFYSAEAIKKLSPKSLFALILGFEAGDQLVEENFATNFLFSGKTQSVGTLIADPKPQFKFGTLSPFGDFWGKAKFDFQMGSLPIVNFSYRNKKLVTTQVVFKNVPNVYLNKEKSSGVSFFPVQKLLSKIELKKKTFYYDSTPIFEISDKGGVLLKDNEIELEQKVESKNILKWNVLKNKKLLGVLYFYLEDSQVDSEIFEGDGILIDKVDSDLFFESSFVENSTRGKMGISFSDQKKLELSSKKLGSPKNSAEDLLNSEENVWDFDWKVGTLFGAKNSIGDSSKFGASDLFILLGDPTLSVQIENSANGLGFKKDIGTPIWKASFGTIDQILTMDINGDGNLDILTRIENELFALYQVENNSMKFREIGVILNFEEGVKKVEVLERNSKKEIQNNLLDDLLQLDLEGNLILFRNNNGVFSREKVLLNSEYKIVDFYVAMLNDDNFQDVVVLDENNNLNLLFGKQEGFASELVFLENFSPNFISVDEAFLAKEESKSQKYLEQFLITYEGLDEYVGIRDLSVQKFSLANNSADLEKLMSVEDLESAISGIDIKGKISEATEKSFLSLVKNDFLDATYMMDVKNPQVKLGDEITVKLSLKTNKFVKGFEFMVPMDDRLEFEKDSFKCDNCVGVPSFRSQISFGQFWVYGMSLPAKEKVTFSWKLKVQTLPKLQFFVGDFEEGKDRLSDIIIQKEISGEKSLIKFLSSQKFSQLRTKNWLASTNNVGVTKLQKERYESPYSDFEIESSEDKSPMAPETMTNFLGAMDDKERSDYFYEKFSNDTDGDGVPDSHDLYPKTTNDFSGILNLNIENKMGELSEERLDFLCGGGDCFNFPISKAFLAPGLSNLYIPPFTIPIGFEFGFPIIQWLTTLWVGPIPVPAMWPAVLNGMPGLDNPYTAFTGIYPSLGRLYMMPTTTGQIGMGFCMGPYATAMIPPLWIPNCFVSIPPIQKFMDICPISGLILDSVLLGSATSAVSNKSGGLINISSEGTNDGASGNFTVKSKESSNIQIPGAGIIPTWLQDQTREFSKGVQMPTVTFNGPSLDFSKSESMPPEGGGALEQLQAEISKYPFVNIKTEKVTIPIPNISGPDMDQFKIDMTDWKEKFKVDVDLKLPDVSDLTASLEALKTKVSNINMPEVDMNVELPDFSKITSQIEKYKSDMENYKSLLQTKLADFKVDYSKNCLNTKTPVASCLEASDIIIETDQFMASLDQQLNQLTQFKSKLESLKDIKPKLEKLKNTKTKIEVFKTNVQTSLDSLSKIKEMKIGTEELQASVEDNMKTLESYKEFDLEKLVNFRIDIVEKMSELMGFMETISQFFTGWFAENDKRLEAWKTMQDINFQILTSWQMVPQVFIDFTSNCRTCVVDRGTLLSWLLKIFLGAIKLPVATLSVFPDVNVDMSNVSMGMNVTIPDVEVKEVDMNLFSLPEVELPDFSFVKSLDFSEALKFELPDFGMDDFEMDLDLTSLEDQLKVDFELPTFDFKLPNFNMNSSLEKTFTLPELPEIAIPDFEIPDFKIPEIAVPDLPTLDLPEINLPTVPLLPASPQFDLSIPFPTVPMPQLAMVPPAPQLPDILGSLLGVLELPLAFLDIFCLLRLGILPVPEWYVKPYVEQLTNRSELSLGLDFAFPSLPDISLGNKSLNIVGALGFMTPLDPLIQTVKMVSTTFKEVIDKASSGENGAVDSAGMGSEIQAGLFNKLEGIAEFRVWQNNFSKEVRENDGEFSDPKVLVQKMQQRARKLIAQTESQKKIKDSILAINIPSQSGERKWKKDLKNNFEKNLKMFASVKNQLEQENRILAQYKDLSFSEFWAKAEIKSIFKNQNRYLVNGESDTYEDLEISFPNDILKSVSFASETSSADETPTLAETKTLDLPEVNDMESVAETKSEIPDGIYYKDNESGIIEKITEFPINGFTSQALADLNGDGIDEILFSVNSELYFKNRVFTSISLKNYNVKTWKKEDFENIFSSVTNIWNDDSLGGIGLLFDRFKSEIPYFEWVLSDRADVIFEIAKKPSVRSSHVWERHAFIPKESSQKNKISSVSLVVKSVKGQPKIKMPRVERFESVDECNFLFSKENYVMESTTLLSVKDKTNLKLNVPSEDGSLEALSLRLNKNEKITLERGQFCVEEGAVDRIIEGTKTKLVKSGDYVLEGSSFDLESDEGVEIELFDGSKTYIRGGEKYFLHSFDPKVNQVDYFETFDSLNLYGFLLGFDKNKRSLVRSKLLHQVIEED